MNTIPFHEDILKVSKALLGATQDEETLSGFGMMIIYCSGTNHFQKSEELAELIKSNKLTPEQRSAILERVSYKGIYLHGDSAPGGPVVRRPVTAEFYKRMMRRPAQFGWMTFWLDCRGIWLTVPKSDASKILAHATINRAKLPVSTPRKSGEADWQHQHRNYFLNRDKRTWDYVIKSMSEQVD